MVALAKLSRPVSRYRQITLWVVGGFLLLQLLAVLSTWQCSGPSQRASQGKPPFTSLLLWLSGHTICDGEADTPAFDFEGALRHSNTVRRQRPYAYAFCLTSVHHLCTALVNTMRLRKLQSFEEADIIALVPKTWNIIIEKSQRRSSMRELQQWAVQHAQKPPTSNNPDVLKAFLKKQQQLHVFEGIPLADYNLIGMFARMIALGVVFRPTNIFEHKPGSYNSTHYQRESISKLELFGMTEYKQVLYLDADGLILQNLDATFNANMTSVALIPAEGKGMQGGQYATRLMLLQPSKAVQAQLQFVVEKDSNFNDARVMSEFFVDQVQTLSANLALQSCELLTANHGSTNASKRLQEALYIHFYDGPTFPKHWQWVDPSRIPRMLSSCTEMCDERMSWLHVYSMLAIERDSLCLWHH